MKPIIGFELGLKPLCQSKKLYKRLYTAKSFHQTIWNSVTAVLYIFSKLGLLFSQRKIMRSEFLSFFFFSQIASIKLKNMLSSSQRIFINIGFSCNSLLRDFLFFCGEKNNIFTILAYFWKTFENYILGWTIHVKYLHLLL